MSVIPYCSKPSHLSCHFFYTDSLPKLRLLNGEPIMPKNPSIPACSSLCASTSVSTFAPLPFSVLSLSTRSVLALDSSAAELPAPISSPLSSA